jgi:hypothetical protein
MAPRTNKNKIGFMWATWHKEVAIYGELSPTWTYPKCVGGVI